jgi:hypothetical protein
LESRPQSRRVDVLALRERPSPRRFAVPIAVVKHAVNVAPDGEVSSKARVLAESISEGMNFTAPLLFATPAAILVWVLAVWRARKAATRAAPAPR